MTYPFISAALLGIASIATVQAAPADPFLGAFVCSTNSGANQYVSLGRATRNVRDVSAPHSVVFSWEASELAEVAATIVERPDGSILLFGVPGGTLTLRLQRDKPALDGDFSPFFTLSDQVGRSYDCGYAGPDSV